MGFLGMGRGILGWDCGEEEAKGVRHKESDIIYGWRARKTDSQYCVQLNWYGLRQKFCLFREKKEITLLGNGYGTVWAHIKCHSQLHGNERSFSWLPNISLPKIFFHKNLWTKFQHYLV